MSVPISSLSVCHLDVASMQDNPDGFRVETMPRPSETEDVAWVTRWFLRHDILPMEVLWFECICWTLNDCVRRAQSPISRPWLGLTLYPSHLRAHHEFRWSFVEDLRKPLSPINQKQIYGVLQSIRPWRYAIFMIFSLLIIHSHDRMSSVTRILHTTTTWNYFASCLPDRFIHSPKVEGSDHDRH